MTRAGPRWIVVAMVLAVAAPQMVHAQSSGWCGTYELDEEASDDLAEAFEPAIAELSRIRRPFARRALRRHQGPARQLELSEGEDTITIRSGDSKPVTIPLNGEEVQYHHRNGEVARIQGEAADGVLVTRATREDLNYTATYEVNGQGKLVVDLEVEVHQLPKVVDYRLVYRRRER